MPRVARRCGTVFFFSFTTFFLNLLHNVEVIVYFLKTFLKKLSDTEKENTKPEKSGSSSALFPSFSLCRYIY
jgi:hypothetical protein